VLFTILLSPEVYAGSTIIVGIGDVLSIPAMAFDQE